MAELERLTVTLPAEMAISVRDAVAEGDYASASEVVRAALRDWKLKRLLQLDEMAALKAEIERGMADVSSGRLTPLDLDRIIERGRQILKDRSSSA